MTSCTLSPTLTRIINSQKYRTAYGKRIAISARINKALTQLEEVYETNLQKEKISLCFATYYN